MTPSNATDRNYKEWQEYRKGVLEWPVKVWRSFPDLPDEAWPLLFRLLNLLDELDDAIDKGDFMEACRISVIIGIKQIRLWHILELARHTQYAKSK